MDYLVSINMAAEFRARLPDDKDVALILARFPDIPPRLPSNTMEYYRLSRGGD